MMINKGCDDATSSFLCRPSGARSVANLSQRLRAGLSNSARLAGWDNRGIRIPEIEEDLRYFCSVLE